VAAAPVTPPAASAPPVPVGMRRLAARGDFAGNVANGLNKFFGHPADGRENLTQGQPREDTPALLNAMFSLSGGPFLEGMIHLMADPAGLLDCFAHGKNQTWNRHLRPLLEVEALGLMMANTIATAGFSKVGKALPGVDKNNSHLGLMAIALPDHFGGGTQLAGGAIDRGGGPESAEFKLKDSGGVTVGESDSVQFAEAIPPAEMVAQLGVLVPEDAPIPQLKMTGKEGAHTKFGSGADDGKCGGLDADLAGALPFPSATDGKALGPTKVFTVVGMDELRFSIIGSGGGGRKSQADPFMVFWRRPRSRPRRCRAPARGCRSRTTLPPQRIFDGRPIREGRGRFR